MIADGVTFPIAFLAGIVSFLSPCVLPLVPPYLCFITGESIDTLTHQNERGKTHTPLIPALWFVFGFSLVFIALGAAASSIGQILLSHLILFSHIAGAAIILMGLHFLGIFKIAWLYRQWRLIMPIEQEESGKSGDGTRSKIARSKIARSMGMGIAFAFGWTPCIGPILATILALSAVEATIGQGIMLLTFYSAGLGVPFLIAALATGKFLRFMHSFRAYLPLIEKITGILLIITGILFITGAFTEFAWWLLELFPILGTFG